MQKHNSVALVVTSIAAPTKSMIELAKGAKANNINFICIGDKKSPDNFFLPGCRFYSINEQLQSGFQFPNLCPTGHYARKNIGYLLAAREGAQKIIETDDDNRPLPEFWDDNEPCEGGFLVQNKGWLNAYSYFTDSFIWPRGFPLQYLQNAKPPEKAHDKKIFVPVQQGLADGDPDVDAIFRLTRSLPISFDQRRPIILSPGTWCPFNSQNTIWWHQALPLMYLPSYCSFRMTDIWRSLVTQACLWANEWAVGFFSPTVYQDRNEHILLQDFEAELSGYLNNHKIAEKLSSLTLKKGEDYLIDNMRQCYETLIKMKLIDKDELLLLDAWEKDIKSLFKANKI